MAERKEAGMGEHTPGPWFVHDFSEVPGFPNPTPGDVTVSCDHPATITVANMDRALTATVEEARANARLIAAAPDMLTELEEILEFATTEKSPLRTQEIASIRDGIARARGEVV